MDTITTRRIGSDFAEIEEELLLSETKRTATVFKAQMQPEGIRGNIVRYKKNASGSREPLIPVDFRSLHPDDGIEIELKTEAVNKLYEEFQKLYALLEERGIQSGKHRYTISDAYSLVITDRNKAQVIRKMLDANLGEDVWNQLARDNPSLASRLAMAQVNEDRRAVLDDFERMLADTSLTENDWQRFFENNKWIFGYGLRYQILDVVQAQPNYGGNDITGSGGQRGDFLTATQAEAKFTCLVEIKKPNSLLLRNSDYRNGACGISKELAGAISQVQANCAQWEIEGSRSDQNRDLLDDIYTVSPKGIVIIGSTSELDSRSKRSSFERFRRELRNPEIITYDELLERARFIVSDTPAQRSEIEEIDDELPF